MTGTEDVAMIRYILRRRLLDFGLYGQRAMNAMYLLSFSKSSKFTNASTFSTHLDPFALGSTEDQYET